ncbi:MAG: hypothetical protein Q8S04_02055 [Bacteroidales bacterium]|nr:hypothetical protein [Bacteroidales bacterium]
MKTNVLLSALLIINFISPFYSFANGISTPDADKNRPLIKTIDSISVISKELTLIVVGYEGCAPCKSLKNSDYYKNLTIGKTYLDILNSSDEKLFAQLFLITGYPTSIVMDSEWNLKSIVLGYRNYEARIDSVLNAGVQLYDIRLKDITKERAIEMFGYALKALRCYWSGDYVQMQRLALKSRESGEYLFNNYLLYIAATKRGGAADAALYKNEIATKFSDKMHRSIYAEMFAEMQL